jgi:pyrroline-5-carboxylate reductase
MNLVQHLKIGFIGAGNMTSIVIRRLLETAKIKPENIWVSNRTPGKLIKLKDQWNIHVAANNEEVVDNTQIIFLSVKPQDFSSAVEPIASLFQPDQIVASLLAGINFESLEKVLPNSRLVRVMPNTPSALGQGVVGYCLNESKDSGANSLIEELLSPLGYVVPMEEGDMFDALIVSCASGTGFVLELMSYWQDWIEERGFPPEVAKKMTLETFLGATLLASSEPKASLEELQQRVTSKKGVTAAGLDSMRELEIERALRLSFEKAWMRNQELSRLTNT